MSLHYRCKMRTTWLFKDRKWGNFVQRDHLDKGECYPSETDSFLNKQRGIKAEDSEVSISATFYLFTSFVLSKATVPTITELQQLRRTEVKTLIPHRNKEDGAHVDFVRIIKKKKKIHN